MCNDDNSVINGLTIPNPVENMIDNDSINVINNTETVMGFEQNNQWLKFENNKLIEPGTFDDNNDNEILNKGVTLMGMDENDNLNNENVVKNEENLKETNDATEKWIDKYKYIIIMKKM